MSSYLAEPEYAQDGAVCAVTYNSGAGKYQTTNDKSLSCETGLVCSDLVETAANDVVFYGTCASENCGGKADPDVTSADSQATTRVTICHRTCSRTNPWVRITIDDDAWGGADASGCGHQLQHDIRDECANKDPWTEWGVNRKDYLIYWHGTRAEVATNFTNAKSEEKAYWRKWERACPYVRNGACCDWDDAENPCCGDDPSTLPTSPPIACPTTPIDSFSTDIYVTYYGSGSVSLPLSGSVKTELQDLIIAKYDALSASSCDPFLRNLDDGGATIDDSSCIPALNPDGDLVGFRCTVAVTGLCNECGLGGSIALPLLDALCETGTTSNCACPNGEGKVVTGAELTTAINGATSNAAYKIVRIEASVSASNLSCDPVVGSTVVGYVDANGDLMCRVVA
jgi:hypothetical protein